MTKKRHNLIVRTATGAVFAILVLAAMLLGRFTYAVLLAAIAAGCATEFWRLARKPLLRWLGVLYIALCMAAMWFFPVIGGGMSVVPSGFWDARIAPAFIVIVWAHDVFAYLAGTAWGRHKMCPKLSPHKSWEGFAAGLAGAMVVAAIVGRFWIGEIWRIWIPFGLVVSLAAVAGDLAESALKRSAGVKDSGTALPGHGGLLDRFDAMLGAVPAAFVFLLITYLTK